MLDTLTVYYECICIPVDMAWDGYLLLLPLTSTPPSNLMIWAALNAFPFGLITLREDWHHVRSGPDISPSRQLGKTAGSLSTVCIAESVWKLVYRLRRVCTVFKSYTRIQRNSHFPSKASNTNSIQYFFFSSSVFSFRAHLMSEQGIKSADWDL